MKDPDTKKKFDIKRAGKAAGRTAAGAGMAVSLLLGSLFSSPQEMLKQDEASQVAAPPGIVQTYEADPVYDNFTTAAEPTEQKRTWKDKLRAFILRMPLAVRIVALMPMWAAGYAVIWLASMLAGALSLPVVGTVLKFFIGAAVVFGLILLAEKLLFPNVRMRDLLSKRNFLGLLITAGVIAAAGALGGYLWKDKLWITAVVDTGAALLYAVFFVLFVRGKKKQAELA